MDTVSNKTIVPKQSMTIINVDGDVKYIPGWLQMPEADTLFEQLMKEIEWKQEFIKMFGKIILLPRLTAWYGDPGRKYTYSGVTHYALEWISSLLQLRKRLEAEISQSFNSVLCNCYRTKNDSVGWHSDNEKELGKCPVIASLSLGAERLFKFKHKFNRESLSIDLAHGSLLLMAGSTQSYWLHSVPKTKKQMDRARINLTYRNIIDK